MPIITLGTTEPEAIIVETGTLPHNFYSTLQTSDIEMQEPVDFDTKASLIATYMDETENNIQELADNENTNNTNSNKNKTNMYNNSKKDEPKKNDRPNEESNTEALKVRNDLLEFSARSDGSVNCKLCGKIFASRQHWYRHKYRAHVVHPPVDPVPLNKCEKCLIFFKSRKGYLGHMSSKHSETLQDVTPVRRNEQAAAVLPTSEETRVTRTAISVQTKPKKEPDPEMAIPKTVLQNYQTLPATPAPVPSRNTSRTRSMDKKKIPHSTAKAPDETNPKEYQERRVKDESFVMGIIEKIRRQCETEPEVANRRGYSRKPYSVRT